MLRSTDGTIAGTHMIDYRPDHGAASGINDSRIVGNHALLWLEDGVHGWQWWFSDGTNAGTYLLDPHPNDGSWPESITVSANKVYFRAFDASNDREMYVADQTGTTRLGNIRVSGSSEPDQVYPTTNGVVFSADHDLYGREPWISNGTVAGTRLMTDVNQSVSSVFFETLTPINGKVIYRFNDSIHGWQIVASDGTAQGTGVVPINTAGDSGPSDLLSLGTKALFSAVNYQNDRQLYVSDGTVAGTTVLLNINSSGNDNVGSLGLINGQVYFAADDGVNGRELWVSDGTSGGTRMVADINPSGGSEPYGFTLSNGKIYFTANDGTRGRELYVTNGTANGTIFLGDLNPYGDSNADRFAAVGQKTVFRAYDAQRGWELWITDGTVGNTQIFADINPTGDSDPQNMTTVNGKAFFSALDGWPSEGGHGRELWVTDGTIGGTQMIEINMSSTINSGSSDPVNFSQLGSRLLFSAYNSSRSRELWVTDGTSANTRMFDINTFGGGINSNPVAVGSNVVWSANDGQQLDGKHGEELWISNGTAAGTSQVDINQTSWYNSGGSYPSQFTKYGNLSYFTARNATNGNELWQTDGTAAGSTLAMDINTNTENSNAELFVVAGNRYFFRAYTPQFGWELYSSTSATGSASLVKDIRFNVDGSYPDNFMASGNKVFFRADDGIHGRELWVTDGTSAGTRLVIDICPFSNDCGGSTQWAINGGLLIQGNDSLHGYQLYFTDGTAAGTQPLDNNLNAGGNAESPVALGNKILFALDNGTSGREMWYFDTTTGLRGILKDIRLGSEGSAVDSLTKVGNYVYFRANNGTDGPELWRTDGTGAGTIMLANTHPTGDGNPDYFTAVGSKLFFRSEDGVNGRTLWVTDGTVAGTLKMNNFPWAESLVAGATKLFYRSYDATNGWELWVSDGTPAGTRLTKDLNNSSGDTWMDSFTTSGDQLFFRANNGVSGYEFATSNGTEAGTFMLGDFHPTGDSWADSLVSMGNGKMLFRIDDGTLPSHRKLWFSDGTVAGTRQLTNSYTLGNVAGGWAASPEYILYLPSTGKAYFRGWDITNGYELWVTDGTVAGTQVLKNINPLGDSTPDAMTIVGDRIMMRAFNGLHGQEPWISDGSAAGTIALGDINTVGASSDPNSFTKTTNRMFFSADNLNQGRELWVKDSNGTRMVVDKNRFGNGSPEFITAVGDNVVYRYNDGVYGNEMWFSDGTANGTIRLTDGVTNGDSNPDRVTSFGNKAVFRMYDPTNGWEPWITDGTPAGTFMLKDIRIGGEGDPSDFVMAGSKMYFLADDGVNGRQLWVTDGTTNGTIALPANTSGTSNVSSLTAVGNTLYFSADDGVNGYELWKSNGTIGGTSMVKDIRTGALNSSPQQFTVNGSSLYFTAIDDTHGRELWKSDGTSNGTTMVSDLNPYGNSNPEQLVLDGSLVYFVANDGVSGREPFVTDGTANGTGSIDINRSGGSRPERLVRNNNVLYFTANDGFNGTEMWSVNGAWLANTAPNVTRSENAPLPPSGITRPVPATQAPVLTTSPSTTESPSVETSAPEITTPGGSNPEPTVPLETPTTQSPAPGSETTTPETTAPATSAPEMAAPISSPRLLTPPPAGSASPSVIPVAEALQLEQERGGVSARVNGEDVEISQFRITGDGISSDQRDRSPGVIAEIREQARLMVAAFDSFLPSGVTSEISVVDSPNGAKIIGLLVDPNNPSVSIPLPAESVILLRTPTGAMLMGGLNNAGRPSYVTSRGALAITKGGSLGVSISGLPVNQDGELIIMSTPQSLGGFVVDEHGLFEGQVTIPASLPFGTHTLLVSAGGTTIAVGVMVDNPVPMILPATGSDNHSPVMVALFWILFGLGLLMVRRRFKMGRN
jgi:LPXTG-motif cell wall-anchored protein